MPAPRPKAPPPPKPPPLSLPAVLSGSKNPFIGSIREELRRYNLLYPMAATLRHSNPDYVVEPKMVALLDAMSLKALHYLLHKPPAARKPSGQAKWNAVAAFKDTLAAHADYFGIRFMKSDLRDPQGMNYWLERVNTGFTGEQPYQEFLAWARTTEKKTFMETHRELSDLEYFDEAGRQQYAVHFEGRTALDASDDPLDTRSGRGSYSDLKGTYIYVCSARTRMIYSAPSAAGELHHSSFLSGEPVIVGGDWMVEQGKVIYINVSSGHYRPTAGGMEVFARLYQSHLDLDTFVQPLHQGPIFLLRDFLALGLDAPVRPNALEPLLRRFSRYPVEKLMRNYFISKGVDPSLL